MAHRFFMKTADTDRGAYSALVFTLLPSKIHLLDLVKVLPNLESGQLQNCLKFKTGQDTMILD